MPKSCLDGYLTEGCKICPYWFDGSNPEAGIGCGTPFPIMHCPFFAKMYSEEEGLMPNE